MYGEPDGKLIKLENIVFLDEQVPNSLVPPGGLCPFLGQETWVATDGRFSPCCAPDKERHQLGDFSSLAHKTMDKIWYSLRYQTFRHNYLQHDICKGYDMRKPIERIKRG